jgi:hypothetical protein
MTTPAGGRGLARVADADAGSGAAGEELTSLMTDGLPCLDCLTAHGRVALLERLRQAGVGQMSILDRPSVLA